MTQINFAIGEDILKDLMFGKMSGKPPGFHAKTTDENCISACTSLSKHIK